MQLVEPSGHAAPSFARVVVVVATVVVVEATPGGRYETLQVPRSSQLLSTAVSLTHALLETTPPGEQPKPAEPNSTFR